MIKNIVFCTLRNDEGPKGGPGGVLHVQKDVLNNNINGINTRFQFNICRLKGFPFRLQILVNKVLFFFKYLFANDSYFITNDIDQAQVLSFMKKKYSLIFHNQGPVVQEFLNFGRNMSTRRINGIVKKERTAFVNANSLHFPSKGAVSTYFENEYACCKITEVRLGEPLYNIINPQPLKEPIAVKERIDDNVISLFSVGTLTKAKGQDLTVEFIEKHLGLFDKPVRYIIVGKGPLKEELLKKLDDISRINSSFSYHYYESLCHDDVMYLNHISDLYVMLHRISIFDIATLESMSQSCAIVLSKVGGNIDFNKESNIIYPDEINKDSFTKKNIDILKEKNYQVFNRYFSTKAYIDQYNKLINKLID